MIEVLLVALSLSMDAFAVSVSSGICIPHLKKRFALRASFFFGLFQFVMPLLGWFLGSTFVGYIKAVDHWIAFGLLALIGGKMIVEGRGIKNSKEECKRTDIRDMKTLLVLALATSIDALAVGISFRIIGEHMIRSSAIIGALTLGVCLFGFEFGRRIGTVLEKWAEISGGIILIGIGVRILLGHLLA
jgi:putative Mn2+ efflux pump MntP